MQVFIFMCSRIEELVEHTSNTCVDKHQRDNAKRIARDTAEKFSLYMAHSLWYTNQCVGIKKLHNEIQSECIATKGLKTRAILIVDFKMKFEAKSASESTVEHFGKRGIGWHGCTLIYYLYQQSQDDNGNSLMFAKKHIMYIDQILEEQAGWSCGYFVDWKCYSSNQWSTSIYKQCNHSKQ